MAFAGFDSLEYPGQAMMAWLKQKTNFTFCGFYLAPAPSRPTSDWMGKRAVLAAQGWGFAALYVGQQEAGDPGSHNLTAAQGQIDGADATTLMGPWHAQFPIGSVVFLDIETGGPASANMKEYVKSWVDTVATGGLYRPGIYCSHTTAPSLLAVRKVPVWPFNMVELGAGAPYSTPFPTNDPGGCGVPGAWAWQFAQNTGVTFPGAPKPNMSVDLDIAVVADPSAPS